MVVLDTAMTERLSNELASLLAEDDGRSDSDEGRDLLRARLARDMSEGLEQDARAQGEREETAIDRARIAAYLDCALSRAERDQVAAELAGDPVARSDLASTLLLLGDLEGRTAAIPAGLLVRASGILHPSRPQASAVRSMPLPVWSRRRVAWPALAAILLVAALTPAVVSIVREWNAAVQDTPTIRGLVPVPTTGIPACDDFLKKYEACITSKLPEAQRVTHNAQLDQMRKAWIDMARSPAAKSSMEVTCKQTMDAMKAALQAYGCAF